MTSYWGASLLALSLLSSAGCKGGEDSDAECVDDGDCEGLAVCDPNQTCRAVECLDSSQCSLGNHCNLESHSCFTGCLEDSDCLAGEVCDTDSTDCVTAACQDAEIDCYIGQQCYPDSGECAMPAGMCLSCSGSGSTTCTETYHGICRYTPGGGYYCLLDCDPSDDAAGPRGFYCLDVSYDESGVYAWYGDCAAANTAPDD